MLSHYTGRTPKPQWVKGFFRVESTTVTHSSADWWVGSFNSPGIYRHQIEGTTAFSVSSKRHWQSGVNGIAKVPKRSFPQWDSNAAGNCPVAGPSQRKSNPLDHCPPPPLVITGYPRDNYLILPRSQQSDTETCRI